jgi:DinB family protein
MAGESTFLEMFLERLRHDTREVHEQVLRLAEGLREEQLRARPGAYAPSIAFHVWHLARWAEHDAELFGGVPQRWRTESMAAAWGFPTVGLGEDETGTEMGDDASDLLVFPDKAALMEYGRHALGTIDELVDGWTRTAASPGERDAVEPATVANLFAYVTHDNRHLGMIEALIGVLGASGTATR